MCWISWKAGVFSVVVVGKVGLARCFVGFSFCLLIDVIWVFYFLICLLMVGLVGVMFVRRGCFELC